MKSVLMISHGSQSPLTKEEVIRLTEHLKQESKLKIFEIAFLEINSPSIPEGIEHCVQKGAHEVVLLLNFLNSGNHVLEDIPAFVEDAVKKYPHVKFRMTPTIGQHPKISHLFLEMIRDATAV